MAANFGQGNKLLDIPAKVDPKRTFGKRPQKKTKTFKSPKKGEKNGAAWLIHGLHASRHGDIQ